jgi:hypothetical protein
MAVMPPQQTSIDRLAYAHLIRETFARSPLFRDAAVSGPTLTPEGEVALTVRFDGGPTVFGIVVSSEDQAYAVLLELARAMVDIAQHSPGSVRGVPPWTPQRRVAGTRRERDRRGSGGIDADGP